MCGDHGDTDEDPTTLGSIGAARPVAFGSGGQAHRLRQGHDGDGRIRRRHDERGAVLLCAALLVFGRRRLARARQRGRPQATAYHLPARQPAGEAMEHARGAGQRLRLGRAGPRTGSDFDGRTLARNAGFQADYETRRVYASFRADLQESDRSRIASTPCSSAGRRTRTTTTAWPPGSSCRAATTPANCYEGTETGAARPPVQGRHLGRDRRHPGRQAQAMPCSISRGIFHEIDSSSCLSPCCWRFPLASAATIEMEVNGLVCAFCAQGIEKR